MADADPQRITLPADFPVEWNSPEDADRFWTRDRMHQPFPVPVLAGDFMERTTGAGMNKAHEYYGRPIRMERRRFNCYTFATVRMVVPPADMPAASRQGEQNTLNATPEIWERWETEWLPEVKGLLDWWDRFNLPGASVPSLRSHLAESFETSVRCWIIHFTLAPIITGPSSMFRDLYTDLFGEDRGLESHGLTLTEDNKSLETDRELWVLSQYLRGLDNGDRLIESGSDDDLRTALGERLDRYLAIYGHRSGDASGLAGLTWFEDPSPVLATVRAYAKADDPDPGIDHGHRLAERDRLIDAARDRLSGYPESVTKQFDRALLLAQQGTRMQEDHAFWIDQQTNARTHYVAMEAGRRLASAGVIPTPADVNHLGLEEVLEALDRLAADESFDLTALVEERAADLAYWTQIDAPAEIGMRPAGGRPDTAS
ncbi:MAG: hypothetical protein QF554_00625 [Dehalococcoidia bacterium]|jgi:hypothetical protein|nr:hypothetical protein [Dehalococcoidia bacterium]